MSLTESYPIVCFGEVLWDILPAGAKAGGAPMNVTYHLHRQDKNPCLITAIGEDDKGQELKTLFDNWNIHTDFFQINPKYETGKVFVHLDENKSASYEIVQPVAWDFIEWSQEVSDLVAQSQFFVYGTLACRSAVTQKTLQKLLQVAKKKVMDINLRKPFYSFSQLTEMIAQADILKLNAEELDYLTQNQPELTSIEQKICHTSDTYHLETVIVTNGSKEAYLYESQTLYTSRMLPVKVEDTVGCGDAFLAGYLSKKIEGVHPLHCLQFANTLGAFVATLSGGCPDYTSEQLAQFIALHNQASET